MCRKTNEETNVVIHRGENKSYLGKVSKASERNKVTAQPWMTRHLQGRKVKDIGMYVCLRNQKYWVGQEVHYVFSV